MMSGAGSVNTIIYEAFTYAGTANSIVAQALPLYDKIAHKPISHQLAPSDESDRSELTKL
jgi:hypothetical protein